MKYNKYLHRKKCLIELIKIFGGNLENEQSRILVKSTRFLVKSIKILVEITNIQ